MKIILRNIKSLLFFPLVLIPVGMGAYALGTLFLSPSIIGTSIFVEQWNIVPRILRSFGVIVQTQTGLLVALSITLGLTNKSLRAILVTMFVYFFMEVTFDALMPVFLTKELNQEFTQMSLRIYPFYLIGGILIAIVVSRFHMSHETQDMMEKLENAKQKIWQSVWGGIAGMFTAVLLAIVWCHVIQFIALTQPYFTGIIGHSVLGFLETLLRPFGLTTLFESMQNFTYIGGTWRVPAPVNTNVFGLEAIWRNQLQYADAKFTVGTLSAARYISGIFVAPAIGVTLINTSYVENRKNVSIILGAFITISAVIGFTLPIEIILLFTAPVLFVIFALINGIITGLISFLSAYMNIHLITVSGGGLFDFVFFGIVPGAERTGAWVLLLVGTIAGMFTYLFYFFLIKRFNLGVFGRNKNELEIFTSTMLGATEPVIVDQSQDGKVKTIIYALGEKRNIEKIDFSMYRLHITVKNVDLVDKLPLKESGAAGVFVVGSTVQAIFGALTQEYYKKLVEALDEL